MVTNFRHSGIVVSDIDQALFFWTTICGFEVVATGEVNSKLKDLISPELYSSLNYYKLAFGKEQTLLELYWFKDKDIVSNYSFKQSFGGFNHIAFTVKDIQAFWKRIYNEVPYISQIETDSNKKNRLFFFRDRDLNLFEIVEPLEK